jgi:hypothetical protein
MSEEKEDKEDKGFKVVDRRSMSDEEREKERAKAAPAAPPPPDPAPQAGTPAEAAAEAPDAGPASDRAAGLREPEFADLVESLQMSAMYHLGMVQGPDGKRPPSNFPAAKDAIDMLGILKEKTKGNLSAEEDGVLTEGLYVLRMSYLAAMNAGKPQGGGKE